MIRLAPIVRLTFLLAASLSIAAAALIIASMVIVERAPQTGWYWGVTIAVSLAFGALALFALGIARHRQPWGNCCIAHLMRPAWTQRCAGTGHGWQ